MRSSKPGCWWLNWSGGTARNNQTRSRCQAPDSWRSQQLSAGTGSGQLTQPAASSGQLARLATGAASCLKLAQPAALRTEPPGAAIWAPQAADRSTGKPPNQRRQPPGPPALASPLGVRTWQANRGHHLKKPSNRPPAPAAMPGESMRSGPGARGPVTGDGSDPQRRHRWC